MKMIFIVYNEAIDDEVMGSLQACCIESFTKWQRVLGRGKTSSPHLDSNVWPGANNMCMTVVEDQEVRAILTEVRSLRKSLGKEGIKAFVLAVEEVT